MECVHIEISELKATWKMGSSVGAKGSGRWRGGKAKKKGKSIWGHLLLVLKNMIKCQVRETLAMERRINKLILSWVKKVYTLYLVYAMTVHCQSSTVQNSTCEVWHAFVFSPPEMGHSDKMSELQIFWVTFTSRGWNFCPLILAKIGRLN